MPLLAEKSSPVASPELPSAAENLAEDKLSALENFLESLNLPDSLASLGESALALAASFLAALGFDDILPGSGAPDLTNPSSIQQTNVVFKTCPAAPAGKEMDTGDMAMALGDDEGAIIPESDDEDRLLEWYIYHVSCDDLVSDIMALDGELAQLDPDLDPEVLDQFKATKRARRIAMAALKFKEENNLCNP